jgi:hypothetical protein
MADRKDSWTVVHSDYRPGALSVETTEHPWVAS